MELLSQKVGQSGGDIFKFAGDAMIILWTPPKKSKNSKKNYLPKLCVKNSKLLKFQTEALQAAVDIQESIGNLSFGKHVSLSVKIGFGVGVVKIIHVGGVLGRSEYLPVGKPLSEAFEAEHLAPSGGVIIIPENMKKMVSERFEFQKIDSEDSKIFF